MIFKEYKEYKAIRKFMHRLFGEKVYYSNKAFKKEMIFITINVFLILILGYILYHIQPNDPAVSICAGIIANLVTILIVVPYIEPLINSYKKAEEKEKADFEKQLEYLKNFSTKLGEFMKEHENCSNEEKDKFLRDYREKNIPKNW